MRKTTGLTGVLWGKLSIYKELDVQIFDILNNILTTLQHTYFVLLDSVI